MSLLRNGIKGKVFVSFIMFLFLFVGFVSRSNAGEKSERGFLGISVEKMSGDDREEFGVKFGVLITRVEKDEAAFKAGLKKYDVIQFLDGIKTRRPDDIIDLIESKSPGTKVKIKFIREGKRSVTSAVLGKKKPGEYHFGRFDEKFSEMGRRFREQGKKFKEFNIKDFVSKGTYLGVELRTMDDNLAKYFGVKKDGGVLIMDVVDKSPAKKGGLLSGDVILKIDGSIVKTPSDVSKMIRGMKKGNKIKITFLRFKKTKNVTVELGEKSWMGGVGFIGGDNHQIFHINPPDIKINIPEIIDEVKVWKDSEGKLHKERFKLIKEKERFHKEQIELKNKLKKLNRLKLEKLEEDEVYI